MLLDLLDLLVCQLLAHLPFASRRAPPLPRPATPPPTDLQVRTFRRRLATWTTAHGLVPGPRADAYEGVLDGVRMSLRAGLEGSTPHAVELTLTFAHDAEVPELVTRGGAPKTRLARDLAGLFESTSAGLEGSLRSIAIVPSGVRLRFAPATFPELLDEVIADCKRVTRRPVQTVPYR
jgi:hypothetical protein